eukprot:5158375-Pyramimonas_sp.AAC.1
MRAVPSRSPLRCRTTRSGLVCRGAESRTPRPGPRPHHRSSGLDWQETGCRASQRHAALAAPHSPTKTARGNRS